ncbi:MAG: haloacid dehalogenase [Syntrophobacteraceae bacterium]|nr:haloacid dehalogenase [Syntrophobacteraceae bacterium]
MAFDIDGVVADTMATFLNLARERYGLSHLTKEHIYLYDLYQCLELDKEIIDDLICLTLDDSNTLATSPMSEAPCVLTDLARHGALRFVTARIWPESIIQWLRETLSQVQPQRIQVVATGAPESKLRTLKEMGIRYFVEDRWETCVMLAREGIQPILFDQPWNRTPGAAQFPRVENWRELRQWFLLPDNGMG